LQKKGSSYKQVGIAAWSNRVAGVGDGRDQVQGEGPK